MNGPETPQERKRRLHREANQRHRLKVFPNRKVGSRRSSSVVTKDYILSQCATDPMTGCWVWLRGKTRSYGSIRENGKSVLAHRRAWELWRCPIPIGLYVCHHCDNPPCCNPDHLFLGTDQDNQDDCYKKGRMPLGPKRPNAKLTARQVKEIRGSNLSISQLSAAYKISNASAWRVKNVATYRSVK